MQNSEEIRREIEIIKERNRRVEADKAWEISWTRRLSIAIATYIIAGIWLFVISDTYPWLKAFVPAVGYFLSTLSLRAIKNRWLANRSE